MPYVCQLLVKRLYCPNSLYKICTMSIVTTIYQQVRSLFLASSELLMFKCRSVGGSVCLSTLLIFLCFDSFVVCYDKLWYCTLLLHHNFIFKWKAPLLLSYNTVSCKLKNRFGHLNLCQNLQSVSLSKPLFSTS